MRLQLAKISVKIQKRKKISIGLKISKNKSLKKFQFLLILIFISIDFEDFFDFWPTLTQRPKNIAIASLLTWQFFDLHIIFATSTI